MNWFYLTVARGPYSCKWRKNQEERRGIILQAPGFFHGVLPIFVLKYGIYADINSNVIL